MCVMTKISLTPVVNKRSLLSFFTYLALEPKIFFDPSSYAVDESVGKMQVVLRRNGTDLSRSSSVFVRSRQTDPISARGKITTHLGFEILIEHLIVCNSPIILHRVKLLFRASKSTWFLSSLFSGCTAACTLVNNGQRKRK